MHHDSCLGVLFDNKLSINKHIEEMYIKVVASLNLCHHYIHMSFKEGKDC